MAAIWLALAICSLLAASRARSWFMRSGWMLAAAVYVMLLRDSSPLFQGWLG
jgi:hypothetical protein